VIRSYDKPLKPRAGFKVLSGNLFDSAVMKISVISEEFRQRYLSNPKDPNAFEGRAVVFEAPRTITTESTTLARHRCAYDAVCSRRRPGRLSRLAEVVNMQPPAALIKQGVTSLPASATAAVRHLGLAIDRECLAGGGRERRARPAQDRRPRTHRHQQRHREYSDPEAELAARRASLEKSGGFKYPESQTPWQEIQRAWSTSSRKAWC